MNQRDKDIISDIERFRVMSRDLIARIHFSNVKNPVTAANYVLKRLHRDKRIERSTSSRQYIYFPAESHIKKDSTKIPHYLEVCNFYAELCKVEKPRSFRVEPRYEKGMPEPDAFFIWRGAAFYLELQRTKYSEKQFKEKLQRYDAYHLSQEWSKEKWQPVDRKVFPAVWVTGEIGYNIGMRSYKVIQASTQEMFEMMNKQRKP